jgi:hypothetical protein
VSVDVPAQIVELILRDGDTEGANRGIFRGDAITHIGD